MKLTPEQKAFYEYGKAVAILSVAKEFLLLSPYSLRKYADNVARNEAACRAWMPMEYLVDGNRERKSHESR